MTNFYKVSLCAITFLAVPTFALAATGNCQPTDAFCVIHTFENAKAPVDGEFPNGGLISDTSGNLYGTTFGKLGSDTPGKHCSKSCGTVFGFTQGGDQQILGYSFDAGDDDGAFPTGEPVLDGTQLIGTTEYGPGGDCGGLGCGAVFRLDATTGDERVVPFCRKANCADGAFPKGGVILNSSTGYVFGTTTLGGGGNGFLCASSFGGCGTVFRLSPTGTNPIVIHSFCKEAGCPDGSVPAATPLLYKAQLYGTTQFGGSAASGGAIFRLATNGNNFKVLYQFCSQANCADGATPQAALTVDPTTGNLYGTTRFGGLQNCPGYPGCGVIFQLAPPYDQAHYTPLYRFGGADGSFPIGPLLLDSAGLLYGTVIRGGTGPTCNRGTKGCGRVFEFSPPYGQGDLRSLHDFTRGTDGAFPLGALVLDKTGTYLYGNTRGAGDTSPDGCSCGTIYRINLEAVRTRAVASGGP